MADKNRKQLLRIANIILLILKQRGPHGAQSARTANCGDCQMHIGLTKYDMAGEGSDAPQTLKTRAISLAYAVNRSTGDPQWLRPPVPENGLFAISTDPSTGMAVRVWDEIPEDAKRRGFVARADIFFAKGEDGRGL